MRRLKHREMSLIQNHTINSTVHTAAALNVELKRIIGSLKSIPHLFQPTFSGLVEVQAMIDIGGDCMCS